MEQGPETCCLSSGTCPSVVNHLDVSSTLYSSFLYFLLCCGKYWKLFREILVKIPQCHFTDQIQSEELKETSFRSRSERSQPGQGTQRDGVGGCCKYETFPAVGKLLSPICWAQEVKQPLSASRFSRRKSALLLRPTWTAPTTKSTRM